MPHPDADLFGGSRIQAKDFQKRVLQQIETATALDAGNMAFILDTVLQEATGYWGLVWSGDHTIHGDWELDPGEPWVQEHGIAGVACFGDLTIEGDLLLRHEDYWPPLFVAGTLRVRNLVQVGPPIFVLGDLHASGYIVSWSFLRVGGNLTAAGHIYGCKDYDEIPGYVIAGRIEARTFDARETERRKIKAAFVPEVIVWGWFDEQEIRGREHAGLPVWRDPGVIEEPPPPPRPPVPEVHGVDPVALGTLVPVPEAEARLVEWIEAAVPRDPHAFTEPLRNKLHRHPDKQVLLLPAGTHLPGDLVLDWDWGDMGWPPPHGIVCVACEGDLTVDGDVLNLTLSYGQMLFVRGNLKVVNLIKGGSVVVVLGNVEASGLVTGDNSQEPLIVAGSLSAYAYFLPDQDSRVRGEIRAHTVDEGDDSILDLLDPRAFPDDEQYLSTEPELLWALQRAGIDILRGKG